MTFSAYIDVGGQRLEVWDTYSIDSSVLVPSDGFTFSVSVPSTDVLGTANARNELRELLREGREVLIYVINDETQSASLQMKGVIDDRIIEATRESGTFISIEGRDIAGFMVDSSVDPSLRVTRTMRLIDLVARAVSPFDVSVVSDSYASRVRLNGRGRTAGGAARAQGVRAGRYSISAQAEADRTGRPLDEVVGSPDTNAADAAAREIARSAFANEMTSSDVSRLRTRDARPQSGETVWSFCERHAKRLGVLMWMGPNGDLILTSPNYRQQPLFRATRRFIDDPQNPNNIISGKVTESIGERYSRVTVYGRGNMRSPRRINVSGVATDESWPAPYPKTLVIQDNNVKSDRAAKRRALHELNKRKAQSFQLDFTLDSHGQNGSIFTADSTISVNDDPSNVNGTFYITRRTLTKSRDNGTTANVSAIPVGSLEF